MTIHNYNIGDRVKLTKIGNAYLDHVKPNAEGIITELTEDDGTPTYTVKFDDGQYMLFTYSNEIEVIK